MTRDDPLASPAAHRKRFATTRWSLVLAAGRRSSPDAGVALASLCETYWYPLYAYLRRKGYDANDAQDLTQGFFAVLLERNDIATVRREKGKFRAFLIASLQHYLANEHRKDAAQKRGGGRRPLSLDFAAAEQRFAAQPADPRTPEDAYTRQWALTLLDRVQTILRQEQTAQGKAKQAERLMAYLAGDTTAPPYRQTAEALGRTEGAVKTAVHRLRRRFAELLRREIGETVCDETTIDDELRELFDALRR